MKELASIIIRTLNEERYLEELLSGIAGQSSDHLDIETVIIDSGSTDKTLSIAENFNVRITQIKKEDFSFGRSLNMGCEFANGAYLVFMSGHCIPASDSWVDELVKPLRDGVCSYTYGRQLARDTTKFSEHQLFEKYFPAESNVPQVGFFCNNANAAISRKVWEQFKFDEQLTGCEDMELAKRLVSSNGAVGYVAEAAVYHIHDESWATLQRRYEREAIALQKILPEIHLTRRDTLNFIVTGILKDYKAAFLKQCLTESWWEIIRFRIAQYVGAYKGNHMTRKLSAELKQKYFYPRWSNMSIDNEKRDHKL